MKRSSKSVSTPYRYTFSFSLLICISVMLITASLHFQSRTDVEVIIKTQLLNDKVLLENSPEIILIYKEINKEAVVFSDYNQQLLSELPNFTIGKLGKNTIKKLLWDEQGITTDMFITIVQTPSDTIIIGKKINNNSYRILLAKSIFYLFLVVTLLVFAYSSMISSAIARKIRKIDETARHIIEGKLQKRIPVNPAVIDEYSNLSHTLNDMLDTIDTLMQDVRQVNNNIAHDLKTPLNRLRSRIEISLLQSQTSEEYKETLINSIDDIDELLSTFNALLLMGNLDSNTRNFQLEQHDASKILNDLSELYEVLAEEKHHQLTIDIKDCIFINMNKKLFSQAISNLLDNAIKYIPPGGKIKLCIRKQGHIACITISDNGPGIPKSERENVFKRFTRLDQSRTLPGTGLGMALVASIINLHKGSISLGDNKPGLLIEIRIPIKCPTNNN
ncbi:MAG: hypothetical protein KGV50_02935 [Gammaproteobacteria bacterium]|nr:hypothetical protein [Gammaproteobacteria bacterium]